MITKFQHEGLSQHLLGWVQGFAGLLDGLVIVLSLGFCASDFEFKMAMFRTMYRINELKKKAKE